jgi:hypothetical protein
MWDALRSLPPIELGNFPYRYIDPHRKTSIEEKPQRHWSAQCRRSVRGPFCAVRLCAFGPAGRAGELSSESLKTYRLSDADFKAWRRLLNPLRSLVLILRGKPLPFHNLYQEVVLPTQASTDHFFQGWSSRAKFLR